MRTNFFSACFFLFAAQAFAQLNTYTYTRKLKAVTKEDYYSIPLSPEITAHCSSNRNDIRIYNIREKDTVEVPYLLNLSGSRNTEVALPFERINDATSLKCCSFITLKMEKKCVINRISLDVQETNFDKRLSIEGSNDNRQWFTLRDNLRITGFQQNGKNFKSTDLYFPDAEYAYFRIKLDDDSSDKINVNNVYAYLATTINGQYDELPIKSKTQTLDKANKVSDIIVELPDNYMLSYITLQGEGKTDFHRNITIYSSAGIHRFQGHEEERWEPSGSGVITSDTDAKNEKIQNVKAQNKFELYNVQTRKLKIEISNYDDQPIDVSNIKLFSEKAALFAKLPVSDHLLLAYGKKEADAPVYDMAHFSDKLPAFKLAENPGYGNEEVLVKNPATAPASPLLSDKKWLWAVMAVVILIIGYFALSMLKKEKEN